MKKLIWGVGVVCFLVTGVPAFAQDVPKPKGASAQAYEHASDEAVFNRVSDWFATVGKSDQEKQTILAERKAKRAAAKAEKEAEKAKKQAEEESAAKKKEIERNVKEQKEKAKKMFDR